MNNLRTSRSGRPAPCVFSGAAGTYPGSPAAWAATLLVWLAATLGIGLLARGLLPRGLAADDPQPAPVREIFVPFEDLEALLEGEPQRVFLTRKEYAELLARVPDAAQRPAPENLVLSSAEYDVALEPGRARLTARLTLEVLTAGLQTIDLPLAGVAVQAAQLNDQPASLARVSEEAVRLFVEGKGRKSLVLQLLAPLRTLAAEQQLDVLVPTPPVMQWKLAVPGDVEVKSGAVVLERSVDEAAQATSFRLLVPRDRVRLAVTLNNRLLQKQRVVLCTSIQVVEVSSAYEQLHASLSYTALHAPSERFRFAVPGGFEVTEVTAPNLSRWRIDPDETQVIEVELREPADGTTVIEATARRAAPDLEKWQFPTFNPRDVAHHTAVVGLALQQELVAAELNPRGLISLDVEAMAQALPPSLTQADPAAPRLRFVAAWFAPQPDFDLSGRLVKPSRQLRVTSQAVLTVGSQGLQLSGLWTLAPQQESQFSFAFLLPQGWRLRTVQAEGRDLLYEMSPGDQAADPSRVLVRLPAAIAPGQTAQIHFQAEYIPPNWLSEWDRQVFEFPRLALEGTDLERGGLAVRAAADYEVRPLEVEGLIPLDEKEKRRFGLEPEETQLAYFFESPWQTARFAVERVEPEISAQALTFLRIEPGHLQVHGELIYQVRQARVRQLQLRLPAATPPSISIRGLDDVTVKEYTSELRDDVRIWKIALAEARGGKLRLAVDFLQPREEQPTATVALPVMQAEGAAYQYAIVAVEGSPELVVRVGGTGRGVDVGELVDAEYQVGRHFLGAWEYAGKEPDLTAEIQRREAYHLPAAIVERAELVTLVSTRGISQTAARYLLKTKTSYLEIRLPAEARLWTVTVDGKPLAPQRSGASSLLSIPPQSGTPVRDVQITYELPISATPGWGALRADAPRLWLRAEPGEEAQAVPTADLHWTLILPDGYRILASQGTVDPIEQAEQAPPLARLAALLYYLGGGIQVRNSPLALPISRAAPASEAVSDEMFDHLPPAQDFAVTPAPLGGGEQDARGGLKMQLDSAETLPPAVPLFGKDAPAAPRFEPANRPAESPGASPPPASEAAPPPSAKQEFDHLWALEGQQGLTIDLVRRGAPFLFQGLGADPQLRAVVIDQRRLRFLGWGLAAVGLIVGLLLTRSSARMQFTWVVLWLTAALLAPVLLGLAAGWQMTGMWDPALFAGCLLIPYYLLIQTARWLHRQTFGDCARAAAWVIGLSLGMLHGGAASAQPPTAPELAPLLELLKPTPPLKLPPDAVIIPYDPALELGMQQADKVLVPYERYVELWNQVHPDRQLKVTPAPAPFAWAGARYEGTLVDDGFVELRGQLVIDLFRDTAQEVPVPVVGGVLSSATLDGRPAPLRVVGPEPPAEANAAAQVAQATLPPAPLNVLTLQGQGRKTLEITVRFPLQRRGGWRLVRGRLPPTPATHITLRVPQPKTEVQLGDATRGAPQFTEAPDQRIETALPADGGLHWQWRPELQEAQVDQSLTVQSSAVLEVREDGLHLTWQAELEFRGAPREAFSLLLPAGYLLERVTGPNVRGWERGEGDQATRLDVSLLKASAQKESLTLYLSRRDAIDQEQSTTFAAPSVAVRDAALQQGVLQIRRSPYLDIRLEAAPSLRRTETMEIPAPEQVSDEHLLGLRPLAAFRFSTVPFRLNVTVQPAARELRAEVRTLLRSADWELSWESQVLLRIRERPLYRLQLELPAGYEVEPPEAVGASGWSFTEAEGQQLLNIDFSSGLIGEHPLVVRGRRSRETGTDTFALPRLVVRGASQQSGDIVVQADPAFDVRTEDLQQIETVLLTQVFAWLSAEQQPAARLALHYRTPDYQGQLRLVPREPRIQVDTISNVRLTNRLLEETILIDYQIQEAGVREISFRMPAWLQTARIQVPLLRQKIITPVQDHAGQLQVRLVLQEDVTGQLRVLVENERLLTTEVYDVPLPIPEQGRVNHRYVTLENAGRDELMIVEQTGLEALNRQQAAWRQLVALLGSDPLQAYVVREQQAQPRFAYRTNVRAAVETAGARIGLAETTMVVDGSGTYRAAQEWKLNNTSEPYLEIELPAGAQLWTVRVADEPVKPSPAAAGPGGRTRFRIPVVKSAAGDPDYSIVAKYGGQLPKLTPGRRISFPLIQTVNINVEWSQVRLRLPETHYWFGFEGSMRRAESEQELAAGYFHYLGRQLELASQVIQQDGRFARERVKFNLKQLGDALQSYHTTYGDFSFYVDELNSNTARLEQAQQQLETVQQQEGAQDFDNRAKLNARFRQQEASRARNVVSNLEHNFSSPPASAESEEATKANSNWFRQHRLSRDGDSSERKLKEAAGEIVGKRLQLRAYDYSAQPPQATGLPALTQLESLAPADAKKADEQPLKTRTDELRDQTARYAERLEAQTSVPQLVRGEGGLAPDRAAGGLGMAQNPDGAGMGFGGGMGERGPAAPLGPGTAGAPGMPGAAIASLDVDLPQRGQEYFFTTPRGQAEIVVRAAPRSLVVHLLHIGLVLVALAALWLLVRTATAMLRRTPRWLLGLFLLVLGFASLLAQVLPIYGLAALLAGGLLLASRFAAIRSGRATSTPRANV